VVFAAAARERAGNPADHTELACRLLAGVSGHEAGELAEGARRDLPRDGDEPAYEAWRARVRDIVEARVSQPTEGGV